MFAVVSVTISHSDNIQMNCRANMHAWYRFSHIALIWKPIKSAESTNPTPWVLKCIACENLHVTIRVKRYEKNFGCQLKVFKWFGCESFFTTAAFTSEKCCWWIQGARALSWCSHLQCKCLAQRPLWLWKVGVVMMWSEFLSWSTCSNSNIY